MNQYNAFNQLQMAHTSAALQNEFSAQYGIGKSTKGAEMIGGFSLARNQPVKQKTTFTKNIDAQHDQAFKQSHGITRNGGNFTAHEAKEGR